MRDAILLLLYAVALAHGLEFQEDQKSRACNCNPTEAQQICEANYGLNVLIAHENCDKFYQCSNGKPVAHQCPLNLLYNPYIEQCDWPDKVDCGDRPISDGTDSDDSDCDNDVGGGVDNDSDGNNNEGTCNCNPEEAPSICAAEGSNGILVAHENCHQFYMCADGKPVTFTCSPTLLYNPYIQACDWPQNVECGDRIILEPDDNAGSGNEENDNGGNNGSCNCNPDEAPFICAADSSEGVLIAHENCNQYYICNHGRPVPVSCPGSLLYNPYSEQCDWPINVDCGDRIVPKPEICPSCPDNDDSGDTDNVPPVGDDADNDTTDIPPADDDAGNDIDDIPPAGDDAGNDNDGTCNCDPELAPSICAADNSDGVLIAHENCNQFYMCDHGKPVVLTCPGNLLYNPYTEQCDWPENVDCGDRIVPDLEDDNNDAGNDNDNQPPGGGNENDNVGAGNCDPSEAPAICAADDSEGILIAHENCNQFYICNGGKPVALTCPENLLFNPNKDQCDWPDNVDCGDRLIPDPNDNDNDNDNNNENEGNDNGGSEGGGNDNDGGSNDTCNCDPELAPSICAADNSDGVLIAHENCNQFYICEHGKPVVLTCPGNLLYNPYTEQCDWPDNVDCGDRVIPDPNDNDNDNDNNNENEGNDNDGSESEGNDNDGSSNDSCNCNPELAPSICAADNSDGVLIAHENCNQFYICDHGKPVVLTCPGNLLYNPYTEQCDWPDNVDCGDRVIPDPNDNDNDNDNNNENEGNDNDGSEGEGNDNDGSSNDSCNCNPELAPSICAADNSDGVLIAHENCNQFYICDHGKPVVLTCPGNLLYNPYTEQCDWPDNVDCGDRVIPDPNDNDNDNDNNNENEGNDNDGSEGEGNDNDGSSNDSCNCNPELAPSICAADNSDGVLIAHENCNQFYICDHGKPVVLTCPGNLLYNPYTEQCDWPDNVDCGDRVIPDPNDNDNDNDNNNENEGNDNDGSEGEGNDNDGSSNDTCNCNPELAPSICAADNSDGVLIAHENCNQFYICDHGKPVVLTCPGNLLYNPYTEQCDWPDNVDCGDRVIPDPNDNDNDNDNNNENEGNDNDGSEGEGNDNDGSSNDTCNCNPELAPSICAADNSDGVLIAHENCNQFYICDHGKPVVLTCPGNLLYNPYTEQCDWPDNVDCGDRVIPDPNDNDNDNDNNNENEGNDNDGSEGEGNDNDGSSNDTCNCNPELAPSICAADNSDGVLIAHENCNQFYICDHGKPVVLTCPGNLLYNPYTEQCDWPDNVDCGDRVIPDPNDNDNDSNNENEGNDNDGSEGEGNDNDGSSNDTCNCNPELAPSICAADNSDGVLIAHENCNQFYICDHGKPVVLTCPGNLLYNPYTEQCDWPENVDCGDRVIPDPNDNDNDSDNNNENEGNDNGGSEGEGNDNNGDSNDTCNCDPELAPSICAADNSDGVLIAHENCNQFYICDHGKPVVLSCPGNLLYNPYTEQCDWPENVDCGDRLIPDPNDNDSGNDSDELPPGGDDAGNDVDDLPPGGDDDNDLPPGGDDAGSDDDDLPPGGDDAGNDNGDNDNVNDADDSDCDDNNDNEETCNCDPDQAPSICAVGGSDGELIAHENCNQFYQCANGKPVALKCPSGLLYNPVIKRCDWPFNVECGDRLIPDLEDEDNNNDNNDEAGDSDNGSCNCNPQEAPAICAVDGSDSTLIAHENCNQFYQCSSGKPVSHTCPSNLLYNPHKEQCDWPENVVCGDRVIPEPDEDDNNNDSNNDNDNNDNDTGNNIVYDDPSQAPTICAENNSDGILVAHEYCNQFYMCASGSPVAISCPGNLLFNPLNQNCDWPSNVNCGSRIPPGTDDNCACNYRNAPKLCARPDSDGKLIAHENCNQFYQCAGGVPVALECPANLVYNPDNEVCDWPQNVDCSNRNLYASLNKHLESRQTLR